MRAARIVQSVYFTSITVTGFFLYKSFKYINNDYVNKERKEKVKDRGTSKLNPDKKVDDISSAFKNLK